MFRGKSAQSTAERRPTRMIAVGGAKGGIGKSLFVANLGVLLARMGKRTVLVDLDLGGANLHLYMGMWALPRRIDDFLTKKVATLDEVMTPSAYGPLLIGGGGTTLGAANLPFARKLKLLRALKTIDADYVILDLGGDTTYNILDFYLAADQGVVLTTCEPASYLDAYGFIKMALHRRLTRLFAVESDFRPMRDFGIEQAIKDFIAAGRNGHARRMDELVARLAPAPTYERLLQQVLDGFQPGIVVTMVNPRDQVDDLVLRLGRVSRKMLSIDLRHLGGVPFEQRIQQSAKELIPGMAKSPEGIFADALRRIALRMAMA